ncbi:hypothetical protein BJ085DRAFT_18833 [Dimargaris cristalligena]|uniref:Calcium-transporting ATPase n=1 Tax=Dimargaris cristalligena TaxID=215637 RepID=A0A4Q0A2T3_9FUNG|nr:hypothetical protein BJ085DRAFT_18833 [Dimargaris cristalligena]|eukprot:RKP40377.1 hypothetical protein BJ085DRAFT_18833 [Dimargaris cristalligena]
MAEVSPPDPHSPRFQLGSAQLEALVESKDTRTLLSYGGASGLVRALDSSAEYGLSVNGTQPEISRWAQGSPQTLTSTIPDSPTAPQPPVAASPSKPSPARASNHLRADIEDQIHCQFAERIAHYGTNFLPEVQIKSLWRLAWEAVQEKIIIVLCIAAALSLALGIYEDVTNENPDEPKVSWVEGFAIIVAILIVIFAGSINDYQKERQFQQLNAKKEDRQVKVRRNGGTMFISVYAVQVGDVLTVESGDIMCADALVLPGSSGISCDESTVTGESDPIRKAALDVSSAPSTSREVAVAPNLDGIDPFLISGSKVIAGVGTCLVIAVGPNSFYGRTLLSLRTENQPTPLQIKLNRLADHISKLGLLAAVLMLIALLIRYFVNFAQHPESRGSATTIVNAIVRIVITTVTIVVVAVPEGLPLAVTLALAFATTRMVYDNCLVRVLASCETMGNATTICSDKTGTLTENKMTVIAGTLGDSYRFTSTRTTVGVMSISEVSQRVPGRVLALVHEALSLNSTAFENTQSELEPFKGPPTEKALLQWARDSGSSSIQSIRDSVETIKIWSFDSNKKRMTVLVKYVRKNDTSGSQDTYYRLYVKGAPELVLTKCSHLLHAPVPLDCHRKIVNTISEYSNKSLRTIGVAYREFTDYDEALFTADQDDALVDQLTWLGLFGIEDPLRPGVTESVAMCRQAGVMVRMVTGDNVLTARSIAIQCGIYEPGSGGIIMEGPQFRKLSDEEMEFIAPRLQVLARSSPEDKKTLVNWLQKAKEVVAVTGDGTNDGPALKSADIGFSMGITGTEVAKEASSIILMDDNFASIVKATMWGRSVNDSVKKFLQFQLTVNITAVLLAFVTAVSDSNQASVLTAVQLLWVNLIMDTLAALALATDQPTTALLQRPPDKFGGALVNLSMWKIIIGQSLFQITICLVLYYIGDQIFDLDLAMPEERLVHRTLIFNTFVWMQIFNEINARVLDTQLNVFHRIHKNWYFLIIFIVIAFLQVIIVEFGDVAFKTTHQEWYLWLTAVIIGLFSLPIGVLIKLIPDQWLGWLPSSITDNYHHPRDLTWKSPVDSVYTQIQNHPMFSGRSHTSLAGKSSFQSEKVTKSAIALTPMGSPGPVMSPSTGGEVPVLVLPEPAVNHGLAPPTGDSSPSRSSRGSFSFRRGKSAAGLTSAAVMIPAFTLTSVAVNNEMIKAQASPIKDDIYIPTSRDENH